MPTDKQRLDWIFRSDVWKHSRSDTGLVKSDWSHILKSREDIDAYIKSEKRARRGRIGK